MSAELLPAIEIETAPDPDATIIWLHGLGDDGRGWSEIVPALNLPATLRVRLLFPHAPVIPVTINRGFAMRAWYDIRENDFNERADIVGVKSSQAGVEALIAREKDRGVAAQRIVLAGFSQGGAIALYAGLRHAERLAAIVALSTYVIAPAALPTEAAAANRDVPIFMAHGTQDPVVPYPLGDESRRLLEGAGYAVEWHAYPMPHSLCEPEVADLRSWLKRVCAAS
jgi:phospholipase/carboxylesterase